MGIAAVFGVISLVNIQNKLLRLIVVFLILGIALATIDNPYLPNSFVLYNTGVIMFLGYSVFAKNIAKEKRIPLLLIVGCVFLHTSFILFRLPYVYILKGLQIIPLIVFIIKVIPNRVNYKEQMGALVILTTDALIQVISASMLLVGA